MGLLVCSFFCLTANVAHGQTDPSSGYFTLTNGNLWWLDGDGISSNDDSSNIYVRGWTKVARRYVETRTLGSHSTENTSLITRQGTIYLALHIISDGNAELVTRSTDETAPDANGIYQDASKGFDPYCLWYRTGYTGYYYQEWNGYRYYLYRDPSTQNLGVIAYAVGATIILPTTWYNWDFGAAMEMSYNVDGEPQTEDYWIMLDTTGQRTNPMGGTWSLSDNSYNRPDEKQYTTYDESDPNNENTSYQGSTPNVWFYDNRVYMQADTKIKNVPSGMPAVFMPVTINEYPRTIEGINGSEGINGFKKKVAETWVDAVENAETPAEELRFPGTTSMTIKPVINYHGGGNTVEMTVVPEYKTYTEQVNRVGIHLSYGARENFGFNEGGVVTEEDVYYYWPESYGGEWIKHSILPHPTEDYAEIDTIGYTLDKSSRRYLSIDNSRNSVGNGYEVTLNLIAPPPSTITAQLVATVYYSNATIQTDTLHIVLYFDKEDVLAKPSTSPVVRGYVCGGGRMANVGDVIYEVTNNNGTPGDDSDDYEEILSVGGNTHITIHSADSLYAVYGGNDIAGWVQGNNGSTIQLGTEKTDEDHPVHIGYIYGGGCGYYAYENCYDANKFFTALGSNPDPTPSDIAAANAAEGVWAGAGHLSSELGYGQYCFVGKVYSWEDRGKNSTAGLTPVADETFYYNPYQGTGEFAFEEDGRNFDPGHPGSPSGAIPYIRVSTIYVGVSDKVDDYHYLHNDYILIDSLFGGAENAFIGETTVGGNYQDGVSINIYGGTIQTVFGGNNYGGAVAQTSRVFLNVWNTKLTGGDDFVENTLYHGYGRDFGIRYLFGGGNKVFGSNARVNIYGGMTDTVFCGGNMASVDSPVGIIDCQRDGIIDRFGNNGHFIYSNPSLYTNPAAPDTTVERLRNGHVDYEPDQGRYNVRCFFGGNNKAVMEYLTIVGLHSGGVGAIYGGGNEGDMMYYGRLTLADDKYYDLDAFETIFHNAYNGCNFPEPDGVTAVVASSSTSKIIADYVYGGCRKANVYGTCGVYGGGGIMGYIFGGNDVSGDVGSEIDGGAYAMIDGVTVLGNVYAGSDGYYHCDDRTGHYDNSRVQDLFNSDYDWDPYDDLVGMLIPTINNTHLYMKSGYVKGNVYSGGVKANVGFKNGKTPKIKPTGEAERNIDLTAIRTGVGTGDGTQCGTIHTTIAGGVVEGDFYGGGYQASVYGLSYLWVRNFREHNALGFDVYYDGSGHAFTKRVVAGVDHYYASNGDEYEGDPGDLTTVETYPTIMGRLFAGNDCVGSIDRSFRPYVFDWEDPNHPEYPVSGEDVVSSALANLNQYVDSKWGAAYSTYLNIEGTPRISAVYGSGNGAYDYDGTRPQFPAVQVCADDLGAVPNQESAYIDINTSGGYIDTVFGGGNGASVISDVVVLLNNTAKFNDDDPTGDGKKLFVGTIFGGNNFDDMGCVPDIKLVQGCVKNVYGGSNAGNMKGSVNDKRDICGNSVVGVTTYVLVADADVTITDSLFGGCRMSNVEGMSYVDVRNTTETGIQYLYGGNDISGDVRGNTRIDISGGTVHHIWGGSNGRYDFLPIGYDEYKIYPYNTTNTGNPADTAGQLIAIAAMPDVDSSNVNIWGGTISTSVFGGGSMADNRTTCVVVDDNIECVQTNWEATYGGSFTGSTIHGSIFAGGEGYWIDLNAERRGNVTEATNLHLHHAHAVSDAKAYGGGKGGNVYNTYVTTYEEWDTPFDELYGGCWGSDVIGTAHLDFYGINLVRQLFGGNDFTGDVYKSVINVYSGKFKNIFGGGNGVYPDSYYTSNHALALTEGGNAKAYTDQGVGDGKTIYHVNRPNTEFVELNVYGGTVDSCIYGGGKMGTVWNYRRNADRTYYLVPRKAGDPNFQPELKVPDTTLTLANAHKDPGDYSYIIVNIHGGYVDKNIFGGGWGGTITTGRPIVYGLKMLNMDGGEVRESVYGGSEFVNDGYLAECGDGSSTLTRETRTDNTTMRPSSITNITGGTIEGFVYGAGFLGDVFGSVYVNVGADAIDHCLAYQHTIKDSVQAYQRFKPGVEGGLVPALAVGNDLLINHSIYAGANWGTNTGSTVFTKRGFHGGESRILVDGLGYNTANLGLSGDPAMNIQKSIIGAGTSANGGDVISEVMVLNYGAVNECTPSKQLESIQRVDSLLLHNTAIDFVGSTDATSAYISERFSIKNVEIYEYRGYNVSQFDAMVSDVYIVNIYQEELDGSGNLVLVPVGDLNGKVITEGCEDVCEKFSVVSPTDAEYKHTYLLFNNGVDMTLRGTSTFGIINGYAYVASMPGFLSTIVSANSTNTSPYSGYHWDQGMSGFVSPCAVDNQNIASAHGDESGPIWNGEGALNTMEYPFKNYVGDYRVWKVGEGIQLREVAILAHTEPDSLATPTYPTDRNTRMVFENGAGADWNLALSESTVTLPATEPGHYYTLDGTRGFTLVGENAPLTLVDSAWRTNQSGVSVVRTLNGTGHKQDEDLSPDDGAPDYGEWREAPLMAGAIKTGVNDIMMTPNNTFGLLMVPSTNFMGDGEAGGMPLDEHGDPLPYAKSTLVVSGNSYVNSSDNYSSPRVKGEVGSAQILPEMKLYLTYDPSFTSSFMGTVSFVLQERDAEGRHVGDVEVKAYVSTIVGTFKNMVDNVLAMYNNGRTNEFTRKIILPAVMEERDIYVTDVAWVPTSGGTTTEVNPATLNNVTDRFYLVRDDDQVTASTGSTTGDYPHERISAGGGNYEAKSHNRFTMTVIPVENVSSDLNASIGWNHIDAAEFNIYQLAHPSGSDPDCIEGTWSDDSVQWVSLRSNGIYGDKGMLIGTLNGRGSTVLNFRLGFDGTRVYDKFESVEGYVGKVILGLETYHNGLSRGKFNITIYVKTRQNGDTIFLASAPNYVERGGVRCYPFNYSEKYNTASPEDKKKLIGKSPNCYVTSFQQALATGIYQEGDVIAILDQVVIGNDQNVAIQGGTGPAVEVRRYIGHHHEFPGDSCAYRGPMVVVTGTTANFSAKNIAFHGGAGGFVKDCQRDGSGNPIFTDKWADEAHTHKVPLAYQRDYMPDTAVALGPVIQVRNGGTASLSDGVTVTHNLNLYDGADPLLRGALSVTSRGVLYLQNDVTVANNISYNDAGQTPEHPLNGAVYVDGGQLVLNESNTLSRILIKDNYLKKDTDVPWWNIVDDSQNPSGHRLQISADAYDGWDLANVFLTRTEPATGTTDYKDMHDVRSDLIVLNGAQSANSRIGLRKWFPGPEIRDTVGVATYNGGNNQILADAVSNGVFFSDDNLRVFYNTKVNSTFAYLFRCASFKHQWYTVSPAHTTIDPLTVVDADNDGTPDFDVASITSGSPLYFGALEATCPTGGDSLIYRLQGGFAPYIYTWTDLGANGIVGGDDDEVLSVRETPYANNVVQNHLLNTGDTEQERLRRYLASVADTLYLPYENMTHSQSSVYHDVRVSAVDATGECMLYKDIRVYIDRHWSSAPDMVTYVDHNATNEVLADRGNVAWQTTPSDGWTDTNRAHKAYASRNYKSIKVTPMAWVDRSVGTISATIDGADNDHVYEYVSESESHELADLYFCEGDRVTLKARETGSAHFVMWDFDPFYRNPAIYVVPSYAANVVAYFGPNLYWKDHINSMGAADAIYDANYTYTGNGGHGFVTTYNGDVHIYDEDGLAWLISCINGLNGTQARTYRFNRIFIHDKGSNYDMKDYLWTPMGTEQHPFMGHMFGVSSDVTDETPWASIVGTDTTWDNRVIIENIIVNEPDMYNAGFFGMMDSAHVVNIGFHGALVRGSQYVGVLSGKSTKSRVYRTEVQSNLEDHEFSGSEIPTTIITTHYASGGLLGRSEKDTVLESDIAAKFVGDAVYSGGGIGWGDESVVRNVSGVLWSRMQGNYLGGVAGYLTGRAPVSASLFHAKQLGVPSKVQNNYFRIVVEGNQQRVGGVAGYAEQTVMENNYIFGDIRGSHVAGVVNVASTGVEADHNYYESNAAKVDVSINEGAMAQDNSSFSGSGNQVIIGQPTYGVNNLTRVLNIWVRNHNAAGGNFNTWRSDLVGDNFGYPVFGQPDLIPVSGEATVEGCDEVIVDGIAYTSDSTIVLHVVDYDQMIDSTQLTYIVVHHTTTTALSDSATAGVDYEGYGFLVTATESALLQSTIDSVGYAYLVLSDTLSNMYGCDSIITLTLTFTSNTSTVEVEQGAKVKVYPNPTTGWVTVEADQMSHVELYDNEGRRLQDYDANDQPSLRVDITRYASGVYYIRVHSPRGVTIQKVIKR